MSAFNFVVLLATAAAAIATVECGRIKTTTQNTLVEQPATILNSSSSEFTAESIPIIFDSKQHNNSTAEIYFPEPIESTSVFQAVQHQTEKIYEGIVKLFVQLVGGTAALEQQQHQLGDPLLERSRNTASRHAATCFNAIDIVGPNHDGLRDAIVDFHNGLRVERCMSPFNLAVADSAPETQKQQANFVNNQFTLLHWDDVLVKVADKILDIGATRACEAHHHSSDINALAAKKFSHFGVNTWQSHKTCNWADVLNEWSAPAMMNSNNGLFLAELSSLSLTNAGEAKPSSSTGGEKKTLLKQQHAGREDSKTNSASARFYRQMLWKGATGIGCAATLVACGEFDHTVKLYACVYNNRIPEHARDTDEVMCGANEIPALPTAQQALEQQTLPQQQQQHMFERNNDVAAAANNSSDFGLIAASQESGPVPEKPNSNSGEFGISGNSKSPTNINQQLGMLMVNK